MFTKQIVCMSSYGNCDACGKTRTCAAIAQLGERQTEDLKVPGSIPGRGNLSMF